MTRFGYIGILCALSLLVACGTGRLPAPAGHQKDPYLWLEDIESKQALGWVTGQNQRTAQRLEADPLFAGLKKDALAALDNQSRLPHIDQKGKWVYSLRRDNQHPRGLYQRAKVSGFKSGEPEWQSVLDIDAMSARDQVKWVFKAMECLPPDHIHCLIVLSPGGGDAVEMREFNSETLEFVETGFVLPQAKMNVEWLDKDRLLVATNFGEGSQTDSGYPRTLKLWVRGTPLSNARELLTVATQSVSVSARRLRSGAGHIDLISDNLSFWTSRYYQWVNGRMKKLILPETAEIEDAFGGRLVVSLKEDWQFNGTPYKQGSVLLADPKALIDTDSITDIEGKPVRTNADKTNSGAITLLAEPSRQFVIEEVHVTPQGVLVVALEDVKSRTYLFQPVDKAGTQWVRKAIDLPTGGYVHIETINHETGEFFARYEDFLTPPRLYFVNPEGSATIAIAQEASFDSSAYKVEQHFATSRDGTQVPYFVVMNKRALLNGENPTHMFSYGGFRVSLTPSYSGSYEDLNGAYGRMWLERGGVFVLANIRGGAEYGPAWHAAVLLENRTKAYEDFEAVAEDLFARGITSPKHLGIEGRSNGGLLVGATMVRRPDLYGAVICGVPLLDMRRYHTLLAGNSWMAEYGNPDMPEHWAFISRYAPYQNVSAERQYPPVFFFTSTRDDRVHPGHARKMAARMLAQGHVVDYYENIEGGHGGSSTNEQLAHRLALSYTHLWRHLK